MKKTILLYVLLCSLMLCGCGASNAAAATFAPISATAAPPEATATPEPTEAPTPEPTEEPVTEEAEEELPGEETEVPAAEDIKPVEPGTYTYSSGGKKWVLTLRDDGLYTLTDPDGNQHAGESWTTESENTVLCGPTDIYDEDFVFDGGCSRWTIKGKTCKPVKP